MGGGMGHLYTIIIRSIFNSQDIGNRSVAVIIGATSMLSSYTRMTYSLGVIMMETTQSLNLFIPILLSMIISYGMG
jgi:H+/Cl- antiporter ClcA